MPGVVITTGVRTGPSGVIVAPSSTWFVVGTAERGSVTDPQLITSFADFETYYGTYNASFTLHQNVKTFFEEGGARCYVSRAVGASAVAGTLTLNASGAVPALTLTAKNPGAWSANLRAEVLPGVVSGFILRLTFNNVLVFSTGDVATVTEAVNKVNASTVAGIYATAAALQPASALVTVAATPFSSGANGTAPTTAQLVTALGLFSSALGSGAVSIPGQFGTTAYNGIIAHAVATNRIALLGFDPAANQAAAITAASAYYTATGAEYAAFYYPHITVPGPSDTLLTLSPEAYAAAKRSLAHNQYGPWQAPAGLVSQAYNIVSLADTTIDKTKGDALDAARINAIRVIQGTIRIYGARSVSSDETNYRYITYRDLLNYIVVESEKALEDLVFSTIDGRRTVFGRVEARLIGLLDPIRFAGGLYAAFDADGNQIDPGYSVEVSDALNPVAQLATGLVKGRVGVRVSAVGDRIEVQVLKSNLTSSVV